MSKRVLEPNTTLYPVPVVLITTGGDSPDVMTCNRITSCSAEPPRLCIAVRPTRFSHTLIQRTREFVVNLPSPEQALLTDYVGVVTGRAENKLEIAGLRLAPGLKVKTPLLAECPVNIECVVEQQIDLDSHTLFIGLVQTVQVEESLLDENGDVDFRRARGLSYDSGVVRERPTYKFRVPDLRQALVQERQAQPPIG
jgi:flavin reductase (DIM6/NTAB) family NADH-FMN oxidoreductase RutF